MTAPPGLAGYPHLASGKVREIYRVDDDLLLFVASDRISAYDHVLPTAIPDKGRVLTAMSVFWFELLADVVGNHLCPWTTRESPMPCSAGPCWCGDWRCCPSSASPGVT